MSTKSINSTLMKATFGSEIQPRAKLPTSRSTVAIVPDQAAMQDSCPTDGSYHIDGLAVLGLPSDLRLDLILSSM